MQVIVQAMKFYHVTAHYDFSSMITNGKVDNLQTSIR